MSKVHHFTTRSQGYNTWGLSFNRQHGYYTVLIDYDKEKTESHYYRKKSNKPVEIQSPGICPKCHCELPLSGKCDCE